MENHFEEFDVSKRYFNILEELLQLYFIFDILIKWPGNG